jgi:hypothetical protein
MSCTGAILVFADIFFDFQNVILKDLEKLSCKKDQSFFPILTEVVPRTILYVRHFHQLQHSSNSWKQRKQKLAARDRDDGFVYENIRVLGDFVAIHVRRKRAGAICCCHGYGLNERARTSERGKT